MTPPSSPNPLSFTADCVRQANQVMLRVAGRLVDPRPLPAWSDCVDSMSASDVRVDMAAVTEIDARGLGLLAELTTRVRRSGGHLSVVKASPRVRRLLRVTHLDSLLAEEHAGPRRAA